MVLDLPQPLEDALKAKAQELGVVPEGIVLEALEAYLRAQSANNGSKTRELTPNPHVIFVSEFQTYEQHRARLEAEHRGKHVLIRGDEIVGIFATSEEAGEVGVEQFGLEPFLVHEIGEPAIEILIGVP